jgi:hypothetical protein
MLLLDTINSDSKEPLTSIREYYELYLELDIMDVYIVIVRQLDSPKYFTISSRQMPQKEGANLPEPPFHRSD